ncbi:MAG: flagellar motor switch protein FliG [Acidobacteria bacterium]|jgi:flagellar motor switch protein FliG|nr:flagellar motor switch protein FliG [Acidobacteriota bacterium]
MSSTSGAQRLSGPKKAAIVMMSLDDQASSAVFRCFQDSEIEKIAREIALLETVTLETGDAVLREATELAESQRGVASGGLEHARRMLAKSLDPEQSRRILDRVLHAFPTVSGFASLERVNPQQLSKFILGEHPQTVALILAHLNPSNAAQLISQLPDDMRADVLMRMASLEDIPPEVVNRISGVIEQRLKGFGGPAHEQRGGVRAVAELCNRLDRGVSKPALEHIESSSPDMAVAIRNLMFVFEDLVHVEDAGIREIVNRSDKKSLTIGLKGASEDVRNRFFQNISKRAGELIKEEMELMGAIRLREVEKAQQEIVAVARRLEDEGVITLGGNAGEAYVV